MKRDKILLIGASRFRGKNKKYEINGQTIKIKNIYNLLKKETDIQLLNTKEFSIFELFNGIKNQEKVIFLLGERGLLFLFPIIYLLCKILKKNIYYIVVGGWLDTFLIKYKIYIKYLKKIDKILVESKILKNKLWSLGLNNVEVLYNFREINPDLIIEKNKENSNFKLVYFSRITEEKGIFELIEVMEILKNKNITLDIWGVINSKDEDKFYQKIENSSNIFYKGVLEKNIEKELSTYDMMIFPTYYEGEGQPGVIVEAFIAELPVLATKWRYNEEYIEEGKTGFLYEVNNCDELIKKILQLYSKKEMLEIVRKNLKVEKFKYGSEEFKKAIKKYILNN